MAEAVFLNPGYGVGFVLLAHRCDSTQSGTKNLASGHSLRRDYFADCHCATQDRTPGLSAAPQLPADHLREPPHPWTDAPPGARIGSSRAGTGTPRTRTRPPSTGANQDRWGCSAAAAADSARRPAPGPASRRAATLAGSSRRTAAAVAAAAAGRRPALRDPPTLCRRFCVTTRWGPELQRRRRRRRCWPSEGQRASGRRFAEDGVWSEDPLLRPGRNAFRAAKAQDGGSHSCPRIGPLLRRWIAPFRRTRWTRTATRTPSSPMMTKIAW